ncbi:hypothetical protein [Phytohabitans houttuyneae]|uniref:Uncharacterized protein n=1 Tax=Phytohabitans houttuyneae TaxID=1076126 RepID=A0A6V8KPP6_9ACTN|nr:hypothetical protein [Phytohabitans houttuyneae]GFJ82655.1 hypothetical protein Phou_068350 [Phytohabitans houttuyneae]
MRAARGAGRDVVRGVTVARLTRTYHVEETGEPYDVHYLSVDDGTRDEFPGWEVPKDVYDALPDGTPADALVSGDRRYLYTLVTPPTDSRAWHGPFGGGPWPFGWSGGGWV